MESHHFPTQSGFERQSTRRQGKIRRERHAGRYFTKVPKLSLDDGGDNACPGPSQGRGAYRHPLELRGRAIGLWYAKQHGRNRKRVKHTQLVTIGDDKAKEIQQLLGDINDDKALVQQEIAARASSSVQTEVEIARLRPGNDFYQKFLRHQAEAKTIEEGGLVTSSRPRHCLIKRDDCLDEQLWRNARMKSSPRYFGMQEYRKQLPAYRRRQEILHVIETHQVVVITGETGCGKTTQVPQYILDSYIYNGNGSLCYIVCTQPRRISAISVAERVAEEREENIGSGHVGYHIRLENKCPANQGSIVFCTTGVVLKYLEGDPFLSRASHLILDEIHERDIDSDFLMAIIKDVIVHRPDLKLILMSATLNASKFSRYFGNCPMLNIPGFTYPVKVYFLEDILEMTGYAVSFRDMKTLKPMPKWRRNQLRSYNKEEQYEALLDDFLHSLRGRYSDRVIDTLANIDEHLLNTGLIKEVIKYICFTQPRSTGGKKVKKPGYHIGILPLYDPNKTNASLSLTLLVEATNSEYGAILVFLPGWDQIASINKLLIEDPFYSRREHLIIPLHSRMATVNQRMIFARPPYGVRKIILATNIAETSITINDVVYVVDSGKIKIGNFVVEKNIATLTPEWVSLANARQRQGRAGRVQPGICYHLYTRLRERVLDDYQLPEIQRAKLEGLCLLIKSLKLGKIKPLVSKTMDPPLESALDLAISTLQKLNALDSDENLTPLGYHLAKLPLDPQTGKMILFGAIFGCLDPILTVAASLSFRDPFHCPLGKEQVVDNIRYELADGSKSDHIMLIKAYQGWELACSQGNDFSYCRKNFLTTQILNDLKAMRDELAGHLYEVKLIDTPRPDVPSANVNSGNMKLIRAVICAGLYPNVAQMKLRLAPNSNRNKAPQIFTNEDGRVFLHRKSVNRDEQDFDSPWLVYYQKLKSTSIFIHDSTMVAPLPLIFFGGKLTFTRDRDNELITVDDYIKFHCVDKVAKLILQLRIQLDNLLNLKISHPGATEWDPNTREGAIIRAIIELITSEEILMVTETTYCKKNLVTCEPKDEDFQEEEEEEDSSKDDDRSKVEEKEKEKVELDTVEEDDTSKFHGRPRVEQEEEFKELDEEEEEFGELNKRHSRPRTEEEEFKELEEEEEEVFKEMDEEEEEEFKEMDEEEEEEEFKEMDEEEEEEEFNELNEEKDHDDYIKLYGRPRTEEEEFKEMDEEVEDEFNELNEEKDLDDYIKLYGIPRVEEEEFNELDEEEEDEFNELNDEKDHKDYIKLCGIPSVTEEEFKEMDEEEENEFNELDEEKDHDDYIKLCGRPRVEEEPEELNEEEDDNSTLCVRLRVEKEEEKFKVMDEEDNDKIGIMEDK